MKSNFSKRLQHLIDLKKRSQVDVAKGIGVSESRISIWLSGETGRPQRKKLQSLAEYFKCDIDWLADGKGTPPTEIANETINQEFKLPEQESKEPDDQELTNQQFKELCAANLDFVFEYIADVKGKDSIGIMAFVEELLETHDSLRLWLYEKKQERENNEDMGVTKTKPIDKK